MYILIIQIFVIDCYWRLFFDYFFIIIITDSRKALAYLY